MESHQEKTVETDVAHGESSIGVQSPPRLARLLAKRSPSRDVEEVGSLASGRRESFLQERKDRLAQRRLQHGQVLARGRVDVPAKLEALRESLSAAQAARSAIYARIAANGSKEVAKVQLVVSQNKEKLRLERETKRLALEVKLAEAAKRREAVLRGRRSGRRSASPRAVSPESDSMDCDELIVVEPKTPEVAALCIQQWWRRYAVSRRAKAFSALHLDHETVAEVPFEVIADVIKSKDVIQRAGRLLSVAGLLPRSESQAKQEAKCRIFLSTYMIVGHPSAILMRHGILEDQLVKVAKDFALIFARWVTRSAAGAWCCQRQLQQTWRSYTGAFQDWRHADSANLLEVMVAQYCELDLIYQIVKMDSDPIVAAEYHTAIKDNQLLLLARIRGIAGDQTRELIKNAVLAARRKRLPSRSKASVESHITGQGPQATNLEAIQFFSIGQRQTRLSNRQLIHELALDPAYQISKPIPSAVDAELETSMKQNFFDSLQAEMRLSRSASWVPIVVQECKMRLLRLVMPDSPTFKAITAAFDIPMVEAECRRNIYDFLSFTTTVIDMMRALCSPARDSMVSAITVLRGVDDIDLFAKRIDSIFEVLDVLLLDSANFHLTMSAARLTPEAVPYEQKLFQQDLESGKTSLSIATQWLQSTRASLQNDLSSRDPEKIEHVGSRVSAITAFYHAFVQTCTEEAEVPETLHLDLQRVETTRAQSSRVVTIATHMMAAKNLMQSKARHLNPMIWTSMQNRLSILITDQDKPDSASIAVEINHLLDVAYSGTEEDRAERHVTLSRLIAKNNPQHAIYKLLSRRLQTLLRDSLSGTEITSTKIASMGLNDLGTQIHALSASLKALATLNWSYYQKWYEQILKQ